MNHPSDKHPLCQPVSHSVVPGEEGSEALQARLHYPNGVELLIPQPLELQGTLVSHVWLKTGQRKSTSATKALSTTMDFWRFGKFWARVFRFGFGFKWKKHFRVQEHCSQCPPSSDTDPGGNRSSPSRWQGQQFFNPELLLLLGLNCIDLVHHPLGKLLCLVCTANNIPHHLIFLI